MKKILLFVMILLSSFLVVNVVKADQEVDTLYIHYYRYAGDYSDWDAWVWQNLPESEGGSGYSFVTDETDSEYNYGGVVSEIDITEAFPDVTEIGIILRRGGGNWDEKDTGGDRYVEIPSTSSNGEVHLYFVEGDLRIGTSLDDTEGPDRYPKFKQAYFTSLNTIYYTATESVPSLNVRVKIDDVVDTTATVVADGTSGTITLLNELDFGKSYVVEATFTSDSSINDLAVTYDGIYDTQEFEDEFEYDGDLGAIANGNQTTFRVWAPISDSMELNLYSTGTPLSSGGSDTPLKTVSMTKDVNGTWVYTEATNLHGTYYTYSVTNGSRTSEVVDPYAKGVGVNGVRGLVVDFSQVNPTGFAYNDRPDNIDNYTDAVIYELHVRDLTMSDTWNGTEVNRGKYLGLIESGTKYEGATTGFDHLKELGITHIQILPFFDYGVVDETKLDDADYNSFNWGYMPLNFNALEGTYSSDPYDGLERIREMKEVITTFGENDIRINMDVVYNHHGLTAESNFEKLVPGYYFRKTSSGSFSNGSGTGNETASERVMMRKFMVDSTVFWATEYNISGFRFDLMGLHDTETMNQIATALRAIDETIMIYGEPWTGGTTPLDESLKADKANLADMPYVGAFNDDIRDGIKGSVFAREQGGYVQGDFSSTYLNKVKYGIVGGIAYPGIDGTKLSRTYIWHTEPYKTLNYVACHDNNTLHDKLYLTLEENNDLDKLVPMQKQSYGLVLTSQGISFIHAGDEFLRSKPLVNGSGFDHNSYESPDSVNQIDWSLKVSEDGLDVYNYVKGLIALRLGHDSFRMTNSTDIINNVNFVYEDQEGIIAYTIDNTASNDAYESILVISNANDKNTRITLPTGGAWVLLGNDEESILEEPKVLKGGKTISVEEHSVYILFRGLSDTIDPIDTTGAIALAANEAATLNDYSPVPTIIISVSGALVVLGGALLFILKRRK